MKPNYLRRTTVSILAGLLICAAAGAGAAQSMAGKVGDKRFSPYLPGSAKDECTRAYKDYVAASGHSAYATTFYSRVVDLYIICGSGLNAPSQKAAEDRALRSCQAGLKRWKVRTASGGCEIAASK